jgi:hypothetical protein
VLLFVAQASLVAAGGTDIHLPSRFALGATSAWRPFAEWLTR